MNRFVAPVIAIAALVGARFARESATAMRPHDADTAPYAPSVGAAPFVSLGYRELAADVMWVRLLGYFGNSQSTGDGVAAVVEAAVALDPRFERIYEYGARAMTMADADVTQDTYWRALAVLDRGMEEFPDDWKLFELAGQIYTQDLKPPDDAKKREWDEKGISLIEAAIRKPGAPPSEATWAATMRTRLGQRERAITELREMILLTNDPESRKGLVDKLSKLVDADHDELAAELFEQREQFEAAWQHDRPAIPATLYVLLGPRLGRAFDLTELATGGRELIGAHDPEKLEPLE